jgi:hypothetical protein
MSNLKDRAQKLRIRVYKLRVTHGVTIKALAGKLSYSEEYTSAVLRGQYESEILCDRLEQLIDVIEAEEPEGYSMAA